VVSTVVTAVVLVGAYVAIAWAISDHELQESESFAYRQTVFSDDLILSMSSMKFDVAFSEPLVERQLLPLTVFPHADGKYGATISNTYEPASALDVVIDMEQPQEGVPGQSGVPRGARIELNPGEAIGPIPGQLVMEPDPARSSRWFPFDEYSAKLLVWTNAVEGQRSGSAVGNDYTEVPSNLRVSPTSLGTFQARVDLLNNDPTEGDTPYPGSDLTAEDENAIAAKARDSNAARLLVTLQRNGSTKFLALVAYSLIAATAISLVLVTLWTLRRTRRVALAAAVWSAAVIFTILQARSIMPGSPSTGIYLDLIFYFPALIISAICAVVLVVLWLSREDYHY
jgi:hypothetical protein